MTLTQLAAKRDELANELRTGLPLKAGTAWFTDRVQQLATINGQINALQVEQLLEERDKQLDIAWGGLPDVTEADRMNARTRLLAISDQLNILGYNL